MLTPGEEDSYHAHKKEGLWELADSLGFCGLGPSVMVTSCFLNRLVCYKTKPASLPSLSLFRCLYFLCDPYQAVKHVGGDAGVGVEADWASSLDSRMLTGTKAQCGGS